MKTLHIDFDALTIFNAQQFAHITQDPSTPAEVKEAVETNFDDRDAIKQAFGTYQKAYDEGDILEIQELIADFASTETWRNYINSLTYLFTLQPYSNYVAPIFVLQQSQIHVSHLISAPMAVTLLDPETANTRFPKLNASKRPYLCINPTALLDMATRAIPNLMSPDGQEALFHLINGILIHESMHITRGDLLFDVQAHYSNTEKNKENQKLLAQPQAAFKATDDRTTFPASNVHNLNNVIMDLVINTSVHNIDPRFLPDTLYKHGLVSTHSTAHTLQAAIDGGFGDPHGFDKIGDFTDPFKLPRDAQYALIDYWHSLPEEDEDQSQQNSGMAGGGKSGNGSNGNGQGEMTEDELYEAGQKARNQLSEEEQEDLAHAADQLAKTADEEADVATHGRHVGIDAARSPRMIEHLKHIRRAKSIPTFEARVKALIDQENNRKGINYNLRHIAYPTRLDLARVKRARGKSKLGMYCFLDVSGSVSDEMLERMLAVLHATVKNEPVRLYVFASELANDPLDVTDKTTLDALRQYIEAQDVGYGTHAQLVFEKIVALKDYKHLIISDYMFLTDAADSTLKELPSTFIIHCYADAQYASYIPQTLYDMIKQHPKRHKQIQLHKFLPQASGKR